MAKIEILNDIIGTEPITLTQAKAHLRVDFSDEDTLISVYIAAARDYAEAFLGDALVAKQIKYTVNASDEIILPYAPIDAIASVTQDGDAITDYTFDEDGEITKGDLFPATGKVIFTYTTKVVQPLLASIRSAMLVHISLLYENRNREQNNEYAERAVENLLRQHRTRFGMA